MNEPLKNETLRLLGQGKSVPDSETLSLMDECFALLSSSARFRSVYKSFPVKIEGNHISSDMFRTESAALARHLRGSESLLLFAAGLGAEVDRLMLRFFDSSMKHAVVLQAASAALLEIEISDVFDKIESGLSCGKRLTSRFSPGYGDFSLDFQKDIIRLLDAGKHAGLALTSALMLTPEKSVTAVAGIGDVQNGNPRRTPCDKTDCVFRVPGCGEG